MKDGTVMTLRENGQLEAKRAKGGVPESIWETYSAFANTNGGLIILGAKDGPKGEVEYVGVPNPEQLVKKFWDGVRNPSKVSANILTDDSITIETINDCDIIRIQVPRANRHLRPISTSAAIGKREPTAEMAREIIAAHPKKSLP